jgi:Ca2+-binding EF-hand superfamily protein
MGSFHCLAVTLLLWCSFTTAATTRGVEAEVQVDPLGSRLHAQQKRAAAVFRRLDTNHDGALDRRELAKQDELPGLAHALHEIPTSTMAVLADADSDGIITKAEYATFLADLVMTERHREQSWKQSDVDHDSKWTFEEYASSDLAKHSAKSRVFKGCPANYNAEPDEQTCRRVKRTEDEVHKAEFKHMDRDGDGSVSKEEYMLYTSIDEFQAADRDGDNVLTLTEYKAAPKHWRDYDSDRVDHEIEREFNRIDINHDAHITREEYENHQRNLRNWDYLEESELEPDEDSQVVPSEPADAPQDRWVAFSDPEVHPKEDPGHDLKDVPIYKTRIVEVPYEEPSLVSEIIDDTEIPNAKGQIHDEANGASRIIQAGMDAAQAHEYARVDELIHTKNDAQPTTYTTADTTADDAKAISAKLGAAVAPTSKPDVHDEDDDAFFVPGQPRVSYGE